MSENLSANRKEFTMFSKLKRLVLGAVFAITALLVPCLAMAQAADPSVIAPELPTGFNFDVTVLFGGLLGVLLPAVAAAIGLGAAIWAVGLIWRKVRGVTW
jgi:hypothetical protein